MLVAARGCLATALFSTVAAAAPYSILAAQPDAILFQDHGNVALSSGGKTVWTYMVVRNAASDGTVLDAVEWEVDCLRSRDRKAFTATYNASGAEIAHKEVHEDWRTVVPYSTNAMIVKNACDGASAGETFGQGTDLRRLVAAAQTMMGRGAAR
ncbi:MAG TPA: hypothetical protein VGT80_16520 [Phenylobacterium sp.]|nr:hypothetical protein [Phenylobacterium sp.]